MKKQEREPTILNSKRLTFAMAVSYPSIEEVEEFNILVLNLIKVKRADRHNVLSRAKIRAALAACEAAEGGIYAKAAVLLEHLVKAHAFASGNRRTAFVAAKSFVLKNGGKFRIADDPSYARVMQGIREGRYAVPEIVEWISNGKIRQP